MLKIEDKDKDYAYIYSENLEEIYYLMGKVKVIFIQEYKGLPAILVRKEKVNKEQTIVG